MIEPPAVRKTTPGLLAKPAWLVGWEGWAAVALGAVVVVIKGLETVLPGHGPAIGVAFALVVIAACAVGGVRARRTSRNRHVDAGVARAARLFAGAFGIVGGATTLVIATSWLTPALSTLAGDVRNAAGLPALALVVGAIFSLPARAISRDAWIAAILDLATVLLTGFLAFWLYALSPGVRSQPLPASEMALLGGYTALTLALLGAIILAFFRRAESLPGLALGPVLVGTILLATTEVLPLTHAIGTADARHTPSLFGWALFAPCIGIALHSIGQPRPEAVGRRPHNALMAVPFAATGLVGLLLVTALASRQLWVENTSFLLSSVFIALVLVVVRQTRIAQEKLHMAHEMEHAKEIAEAANSSRLHFLANISHDLRTPLNGILGCAQILLRDKTVTEKQRELLKTSQGCAEHLRNLINDLLDLSKLESGRLELAPVAFDLHGFLEELTGSFKLQADTKNILLELETDSRLPKWITIDRKRLHQILGNLVHNAIKFTTRGSVTLKAACAHDRLAFSVRDTGCGILPDKLTELFRPFHVVDEKSIQLEGTGLGLSIAKKLAQTMGGDITVSSVYGKGTTFQVDLPLVETAPVVEVQRTVVDYQGHRRRVLIVDDNPANRIILRTLLEPLDFLVMEAASGPDALSQLQFAKPDILILDLMMPEMDGFELCRRVQELKLATAPVCIALSAMAGENVLDRCRAAGFRDLVRKPVNLDLLLEALHTHAGIEWVYGLIKPGPKESRPARTAEATPMKFPAPDVLGSLNEFARRGNIRGIEARLRDLVAADPDLAAFETRAREFLAEFKVKELADWLGSLSSTAATHVTA